MKLVACAIVSLVLLGAARASTAAPAAALLVVSSDYSQWSEDHAFVYTPGGRLRALSLGAGAAASADGRLIGFVRDRDVWIVDAAGRDARRVATLDGELAFGASLRWSRDGRHLAVVVVDHSRLVSRTDLVDVATGDVTGLDAISAAFSPDGTSVAYAGYEPKAGLVIADAHGRNGHVVAQGWDPRGSVAWSADGRWVAFAATAREGGAPHVVLVHPDGSGLRELAAGAALPDALSWSTDGRLAWLAPPRVEVSTPEGRVRTLATVQSRVWPVPALAWSPDARVLAVRAAGGAIALVPSGGGRVRTLHLPPAARNLLGDLSWLGTQLVVTGHKARSDSELELVRADATGLRPLTSNGIPDRDPAWAPDGRTIAFVRFGIKRHGVYTIEVGTRTVRRLTDGADRAPAFAPDGERLAFVRQNAIEVLDLGTRKVQRLATTRIAPRQLSWTLDGRSIVFGDEYGLRRLDVATGAVQQLDVGGDVFRPILSPDGKEVAFLAYRDERYFRDPAAWGVFVSSIDGTNVRRITSNDKFGPRSWSPDETLLAASDGYRLEIVEVATGARRPLLGAGYTTAAAFAPTSAPAP